MSNNIIQKYRRYTDPEIPFVENGVKKIMDLFSKINMVANNITIHTLKKNYISISYNDSIAEQNSGNAPMAGTSIGTLGGISGGSSVVSVQGASSAESQNNISFII